MASIALIHKHSLNNPYPNHVSYLLELSAQSMTVVGVARETLGSLHPVPLAAHGNTHFTAELVFLTDSSIRNTLHQKLMHTVNLPSFASRLLMDALGQNQKFGGGSVSSGACLSASRITRLSVVRSLRCTPLRPIHLTRMRIAGLHHQ